MTDFLIKVKLSAEKLGFSYRFRIDNVHFSGDASAAAGAAEKPDLAPDDFAHRRIGLLAQHARPDRQMRRRLQLLQHRAVPRGEEFRIDVHLADAVGDRGGRIVVSGNGAKCVPKHPNVIAVPVGESLAKAALESIGR